MFAHRFGPVLASNPICFNIRPEEASRNVPRTGVWIKQRKVRMKRRLNEFGRGVRITISWEWGLVKTGASSLTLTRKEKSPARGSTNSFAQCIRCVGTGSGK